MPEKVGVVSIDYKSGLRLLPEQQNLIKTLRDNGIEVYICSASFVDVVKTLAGNPKYGYNLPEENEIW
ncbi:hypothetical protein SH2C18_36870 [Clostridium sediminicola]